MPVEILKEEKKLATGKVTKHLSPSTVLCKVNGGELRVILPRNAGIPALGSDLKIDAKNTRKGKPLKGYWVPD